MPELHGSACDAMGELSVILAQALAVSDQEHPVFADGRVVPRRPAPAILTVYSLN